MLEDLNLTREELVDALSRVQCAVMTPYGRAGSTFFKGLFDQHEEVSSLPIETNVYDFYANEEEKFSPEEYLELFEKNSSGLFDLARGVFRPAACEDPPQSLRNIDKSAFCRIFFQLCQLYGDCGRKEYFLLIHIAFFLICNRSLRNLKLILLHLHSHHVMTTTRKGPRKDVFRQHKKFFQDFPKASFITLLRNPVETLESALSSERASKRKLAILQKDPVKNAQLIASMRESYESSLVNREDVRTHRVSALYDMWKIPKSIYLLYLPGLHKEFDAVMAHVCAFLGVRYDPTLKQATFYGNPWVGFSGKRKNTASVNKNFTEKGERILTADQEAVARLFYHDVLIKFFPEEAKLSLVDVLRVARLSLRYVLHLVVRKRSIKPDADTPEMDDILGKRLIQRPHYLSDLLKEYIKLKRLRFLDISNAVQYKSPDA
ncbi:MAG: sulfotransferase [Holosporales bacterium]|nr:sulfotransferase [Holosporales bacterium]